MTRCVAFGLFLLTCAWPALAAAEPLRLDRAPGDVAGPVVRDPGNKNAKCVEVWVGKPVSAEFGTVPPGCYRLSLRGRFIGQSNVRYSMSTAVTAGDAPVASRTLWANFAPANGKFHDTTFDFTVLKRGALEATLRLADHAREEDAKAVETTKLRAMAGPKIGEKDDVGELEMEALPPPTGTESFLLTRIRLERLPPPIAVTRVWPDKINYYPKEKATIEVQIAGVSDQAAQGTLLVELIRRIDSTRELLREPVKLDPGATLSRTVTLDTDEEYGYEIRATVAQEGQETRHSLSEYFTVSQNVFEVSIQGWSRVGVLNDQESMRNLLTMPQEKLDQLARDSALTARRAYYNHIECFSWAPDDFFNLAPAKDVWWSGTMTYIKVKRDILAELRALQKQGIKVLAYAQPYAIGLDTVKNLRTNPEFFAYYGNGAPAVSYDYDLIKSRARADMGLRPAELGGGLNFFELATVDRGIDALIASWKMFGWDGVRFDNRYYRANNPITYTGKRATDEKNLDPYSARNVKRQKERFWKEIGPRWLISHNNGYNFHSGDNKLGWEETVKDGLMCMDEETCCADSTSASINEWRKFMLFGLEARRYCTELGGYYQLFPPGRGSVPLVDMLHYAVACAATASHPISCDVEGSPAGRYGQFLTRYSAMIFARDIKPLADADKYLALSEAAEKAVWWREFANVRKVDGKQLLLFPLVIPPANPRITLNPASTIPKPPDIAVTLKSAAFPVRPRVVLLTAEREPMCIPVELKDGPDGFDAQLPRISHFGLLVVERDSP